MKYSAQLVKQIIDTLSPMRCCCIFSAVRDAVKFFGIA